jgi:hypothetical protein
MNYIQSLVLSVTHVVLDNIPSSKSPPFYEQEWLWVGVSAVATIAVVIATLVLASKTKVLAEETADSVRAARTALDAENTRHLDLFQAHIAITYRDTYDAIGSRYRTFVYLRNVGPGYARDISIPPRAPEPGIQYYSVPTALEAHGGEAQFAQFVDEKALMAPIVVAYNDAFGRKYESRIDQAFPRETGYRYIRILEPDVQYGDWKGTCKADDQFRSIREFLKERGLTKDDFLVGLKMLVNESRPGDPTRNASITAYFVPAENYEGAKRCLQASGKANVREETFRLPLLEFLSYFKRFSIAMAWGALDIVGSDFQSD